MNSKLVTSILVLAVVAIGAYTVTRPAPAQGPQGPAGKSIVGPAGKDGRDGQSTFGAVAGNDFQSQVSFSGGTVRSNLVSSSTALTSVTVSASDVMRWANASVVSFTPNVAGITLTFPASSTLRAFVPKAGDSQTFCFRNATTTTATPIIIAGGTGTNVLVASSSATALGSLQVATGKVGCFTAIREAATATTYDIDFLWTVFK